MAIVYEIRDFQFDAEKWALVVTDCIQKIGEKEFAALMGMSVSGVWHWANNRYPMGFAYPSMTNFILACNLMDVDPRQFFVLERD